MSEYKRALCAAQAEAGMATRIPILNPGQLAFMSVLQKSHAVTRRRQLRCSYEPRSGKWSLEATHLQDCI